MHGYWRSSACEIAKKQYPYEKQPLGEAGSLEVMTAIVILKQEEKNNDERSILVFGTEIGYQ